MSEDDQRTPEQDKEDLLKLPFKIREPKQPNSESSSSLLSFSNPASLENRLSFGFRQTKPTFQNSQINNTPYQNNFSLNLSDSQQKPIHSQIIVNEIPYDPRFDSKLETSIQRVRKSSFFENQDFSWSDQIQIDQKTQRAKTPHFKASLNDQDLIITEYLEQENNKKIQSSTERSFSEKQQISFGRRNQSQSEMSLQFFENEEKKPISEVEFQAMNERQVDDRRERGNGYKRQVICFKCGKDHYANQCNEEAPQNSNDVKCFNCKKNGHTAKNCFQPRRCHNCNSIDHISRDCPTIETSRQRKVCLNCNQMGHFARECTKPSKCFLCHQIGHQIKNCHKNKHNNPNRQVQLLQQPKTCFNCKRQGHYATDCPEPSKCHQCGQQGHFSRDCPHSVMRPRSVDGGQGQEKVERKYSSEKPASQPEARKNKPFLKFNFKRRSDKKKISNMPKSKRISGGKSDEK